MARLASEVEVVEAIGNGRSQLETHAGRVP